MACGSNGGLLGPSLALSGVALVEESVGTVMQLALLEVSALEGIAGEPAFCNGFTFTYRMSGQFRVLTIPMHITYHLGDVSHGLTLGQV